MFVVRAPPMYLSHRSMSRQCNMDHIVLSMLKHEKIQSLKLSYDIACSWSVNFEKRMKESYPLELQIPDDVNIWYCIPKAHLPMHGDSCRQKFSFNFLRGVGQTHGETVEQEWSHINGAALMTREMGSSARHAALDDHWGGWNWRELVGLGMSLVCLSHLATHALSCRYPLGQQS